MVNPASGGVVVIRIKRLRTLGPLNAVRRPGWGEEGVVAALLRLVNLLFTGKVGAYKNSCGLGVHGLVGGLGLGIAIVASPLGRERFLTRGQFVEALVVVAEPEVELEVLG
jgi:hypothetical protein